ncbi:MAG TPA: branched-chain amino acid ABC transporter permease [Thermodesulfobacteriota bacterium]|nr:branched-chain amino acid ABC transporter permease [Thermodesulfobacteriota bacterium]
MKKSRPLLYLVVLAILFTLPFYTGVYVLNVMDIILIYMALALSWDMLLRSGQISFGMAGFFGVGGYAAVLLFLNTGVHPLLSIVLGGLAAGVLAWLIGSAVLQLRGMYFAIVTLALAEIFRVIVRNLPDLTGGPEGTVLSQAIFAGNSTYTYWLVLAAAALSVVVSEVFRHSRIHFALTSIRNDEIVAKSSGIDVFKFLVFLFAVTSAIQGITGGAYAHIYGFVSPEGSFSVDFTLLPIAMALLGGMHSTWGPVVGAVVLGVVSEFLKLQIPYGHLMVYGIIIVVAILFFPQGIVGTLGQKMNKTGSP